MSNSYYFDEALRNSKVQMTYQELQMIQSQYEELERTIEYLKEEIKSSDRILEKKGEFYSIEGIVNGFKDGFGGGIIKDLVSELDNILLSMSVKEFAKWKKARKENSFDRWIDLRSQIRKIKKEK